MIGRIKVFFDQKGYGFINAEDGTDYFFHLKNTNTSVKPYTGMRVEFSVCIGEKGPIAKDVHDIEVAPKKSFIIIGDTRIKVSNIKMYKIITDRGSCYFDDNNKLHFYEYEEPEKKLYIETFQGDTFTFERYQGIDVIQKCHELDDLLCP